MVRHFIDLADIDAATLRQILDHSLSLKAAGRGVRPGQGPLVGKTLAMVFDKPSTRTRISFDLAMRELGGETMFLTGAEMQLGRGETIGDTARVLSRYVDAVMIRVLEHETVEELAAHATIPVINGLTHRSHPCQVMADLMTFEEHRGPVAGRRIAWIGDANNVLASWMQATTRFGFQLVVAAPDEFAPAADDVAWARQNGGDVEIVTRAEQAAEGADCIVADTWVSMGDDEEADRRHRLLKPFQVTAKLMSQAKPDAIFMHCLPVHRGEEVTAEVIDGPQSVVFDEAENRLHAQKGILAWCLAADSRP